MPVKNIFYDPGAQLVGEHIALIYSPQRRRTRFPENCVQVMKSAEEACNGADTGKNLYPARVLGPSRSSEGFNLYYLVDWLECRT